MKKGTDIQTRTLVLAHYGMRFIVILAFVGFVLWGQWVNAVSALAIFVLMLLPSFLKDKYKLYLPFGIEFTIVTFTFFTLFLGSLRNFYERFPWWDGMLHFLSGIMLGIVGFILVYILNEQRKNRLALSPFFVSFFSLCFTLAMSVFWEIYEYVGDRLLGYHMQENGLPDTMSDLIVCTVGSLIVSTLGYFWMRHQAKVPFTPKRLSQF